MKKIYQLFSPEVFQGTDKKKNYFEGWYFKLIDAEMKQVMAIIPGISLGNNLKDHHSFIQIFDAITGKTHYIKYPLSDFQYKERIFDIRIGNNCFSKNQVILDIDDENLLLRGELCFHNIISYPKSWKEPGIMGPFSFIPRMECYHGIVNIHHEISGTLSYNGKDLNFDQGYGYIEKDWGRSFPEGWIWMQSNHFEEKDISFMFSLAKIPWMGNYFNGFLCFVKVKDEFYRFATYSCAQIRYIHRANDSIQILIEDKDYYLKINAFENHASKLVAPDMGEMSRNIEESISATLKVQLMNKNGEKIFEGTGNKAGLEIINAEKIIGEI